jgi:ABC-type phosphonate transport system ATPase subunit
MKDMTQDPDPTAIAVSHLKKTYGSIKVVEDASFVVNEGEVFGLLGPNGAGRPPPSSADKNTPRRLGQTAAQLKPTGLAYPNR